VASEKQISANRANATKSTGPQTPAGKLTSSKNALTHGNYSRDIVLSNEDPKEFERLLGEMDEAYPPIDAVDKELNRDLAGQFWRLRRIPIQETVLLGPTMEDTVTSIFQICNPEVRKKVLEKLAQLQKDREFHDKTAFFADLTRALISVVPRVIIRVLEAVRARDGEKSWLALARRETSLRNGIARTLAMIHARRANRS
jgi:hypothetical protein